ncbi:MAG: alpha/beta hydrolase [Chitinophagaceae bacterium]
MKFYTALVISFLIASCVKENTGTSGTDAVSYTNVTYGSDARQKMDIYLPAGRTTSNTKVIVLIHGGGWTEGDKADFAPFISLIQEKLAGYAIFNINYRLSASGSNIFPHRKMM